MLAGESEINRWALSKSRREAAWKVTVVLNQNPNLLWHGEGNMLPAGIRQHGSEYMASPRTNSPQLNIFITLSTSGLEFESNDSL